MACKLRLQADLSSIKLICCNVTGVMESNSKIMANLTWSKLDDRYSSAMSLKESAWRFIFNIFFTTQFLVAPWLQVKKSESMPKILQA